MLLVHPHIYAGGAEKAVVYLAHNLNHMGHRAAVCTLSLDMDDLPAKLRDVPFITPRAGAPTQGLESTPKAIHRVASETLGLYRLTRRLVEDYDVLCPCNFPAYWSTHPHRRRKPIVWISSEVLGPYDASRDLYNRSPIFRAALKATTSLDRHLVRSSVDKIVTCSTLNQELIKQRYGLPATVIPTAVDHRLFQPQASEDKEGGGVGVEEGFVLLQVGTLVKRKNQILSIRALSRLRERIPEARLMLVGEGPWEPILRREAHRLGLEGDVAFTGRVSEQRLASLYRLCDLNLFPVEDQTFGLTPFEALTAGKLSLVSQKSGAGRLMSDLDICYPINPSVDGVVKGVLQVWKDPQRYRDSIAKGRAFVRERLTWERYAEEVSGVYESVHTSPRGPGA